ncbi:Pantothenate kinase 2 [Acorus gramineus]|uniref:Pantothenate kinase 2 n=1 Tax=Acorus gramineus TaxID=55184 RepID=A0AAV9AGQ6_ACOGR|nr:Pantothenate kinase 2 [Acorus gramineus]
MERLGVSIDKEDEMDCLVAGANFLLKFMVFLGINKLVEAHRPSILRESIASLKPTNFVP